MSIIFITLPLAVLVSVGFTLAFLWATRNGQFEDLETPAHRILFEEQERTDHESKPKHIDAKHV